MEHTCTDDEEIKGKGSPRLDGDRTHSRGGQREMGEDGRADMRERKVL